MSRPFCDVVVVGARCAGAALATFLARAGARVLVVDRDPLRSDRVLSTHTIHPPGIDVLEDLGVADEVKSVAPASRTIRLRKGSAWADLSFANGRAEYCPRRARLDGLLQDAAIAAGAELRDRTRATAVLFDGDRAAGVRVEHAGNTEDISAGLVVGADGRHSFVARQVGADEYMGYDAPRAMYWAYWDAPTAWHTDEYPFGMYLAHIADDIRVVFQTDHDQLLIGSLPAVDAGRSWRHDAQTALCKNLAEDPVIGPLLDGASPDSSVRGTLKERYFFRQGTGPGWTLVGDAGHHKDFVVGDGITEALLQARGLAAAIAEDSDQALGRWWRRRDVEALPLYHWGRDEGSLGAPGTLEELVMRRVSRNEKLKLLMVRLPEHQCSPYDALPGSAILPVLLGAVARGRFGVIAEFIAQARRIAEYRRVIGARRALLREVAARPDERRQ